MRIREIRRKRHGSPISARRIIKRYYGLDFADRLAAVGFAVETFRLPPEQEVRYGLLRDEWITIALKPET